MKAASTRIAAVSGRRVQRSHRHTTARDATSSTRASARKDCPAAITPPSAAAWRRLIASPPVSRSGTTKRGNGSHASWCRKKTAELRGLRSGDPDELRLDLDGNGAADEHAAALE